MAWREPEGPIELEPEPDVAKTGPGIVAIMVEFARHNVPQPCMFVWDMGRGPHGGYTVHLEDGRELFCPGADGPAGGRAIVQRWFCGLCGTFTPSAHDLLQLRFVLETTVPPGERLPPMQASVCNDCFARLAADTEALGTAWKKELENRIANLRYRQLMDDWRANHPARMRPFR